MKRLFRIAASLLALTIAAALPAQPKSSKPKPLLPEAFSGWEADRPAHKLAQPDPANAAALAEYGFSEAVTAEYKRGEERLTIKLLRFQDASGAYGAYSFYRQNGWPKEKIGFGAASDHNRVLFWQGNLLVDAAFAEIGPMSGGELRELASQLPQIEGSKALAPPILASLPQRNLDGQTTHYAVGPAGYAGAGGVLPAALIGFELGAETATSNYSLASGPATLTLIDYPTPQLAAAQEQKLRAYLKAGAQAQPAWPKPLQDSDLASLEVKRSGPIVALVSGDATPEESHHLLAMVHYSADLTAIPVGSGSEISKTGKLLVGIASLILIGAIAALVLGFFFGGSRILYRVWRGKPASSVSETEIIRLNLRDQDPRQ